MREVQVGRRVTDGMRRFAEEPGEGNTPVQKGINLKLRPGSPENLIADRPDSHALLFDSGLKTRRDAAEVDEERLGDISREERRVSRNRRARSLFDEGPDVERHALLEIDLEGVAGLKRLTKEHHHQRASRLQLLEDRVLAGKVRSHVQRFRGGIKSMGYDSQDDVL